MQTTVYSRALEPLLIDFMVFDNAPTTFNSTPGFDRLNSATKIFNIFRTLHTLCQSAADSEAEHGSKHRTNARRLNRFVTAWSSLIGLESKLATRDWTHVLKSLTPMFLKTVAKSNRSRLHKAVESFNRKEDRKTRYVIALPPPAFAAPAIAAPAPPPQAQAKLRRHPPREDARHHPYRRTHKCRHCDKTGTHGERECRSTCTRSNCNRPQCVTNRARPQQQQPHPAAA